MVYFAHSASVTGILYTVCVMGTTKYFRPRGPQSLNPAVAMRCWVVAIRTMSRWPPSDILDCYFCMMEHSQQVLSEWLVQTHCKNLTLMYVVVFELVQFKSFWFLCSVRWTNVNSKHNIMSSLIIPVYADEENYMFVCVSATGEGVTDNNSQPLSDIINRQPTMT